jgi:hypothetical protein
MRRRAGAAIALAVVVVVGAGCGGSGGTTTVIQERTTTVQEAAQQAQPAQAAARKPAAQKPTKDPVNTVGLPLDLAEELLRQDGYRVAAKNTDTTFGIIDPSNYTICTQGEPRGGTIVPVLAQKYGC